MQKKIKKKEQKKKPIASKRVEKGKKEIENGKGKTIKEKRVVPYSKQRQRKVKVAKQQDARLPKLHSKVEFLLV